jgi:hypothetical protein
MIDCKYVVKNRTVLLRYGEAYRDNGRSKTPEELCPACINHLCLVFRDLTVQRGYGDRLLNEARYAHTISSNTVDDRNMTRILSQSVHK